MENAETNLTNNRRQGDRNNASPAEMTISDRGVELIAEFEGCNLEAYQCPDGLWAIGYGHTAGVEKGCVSKLLLQLWT